MLFALDRVLGAFTGEGEMQHPAKRRDPHADAELNWHLTKWTCAPDKRMNGLLQRLGFRLD